MLGMVEALLGFLRRQVGLKTDAASSSGSAHAKLGDIKSYLVNTIYGYLTGTVMQSNLLAHGSAIKSIQRGATNVSTSSTVDVTISSVTMSKTVIVTGGNSGYAILNSSTVLKVYNDVLTTGTIPWQVVEYY